MQSQITLGEAATYLGVSKATLRNWDNEGKLTAYRNPVNGYRTYKLEDLVKIKNALGEETHHEIKNTDSKKSTDAKTIKRIVFKLHSIIRNCDTNSNIVTRFDEISKLLFVKLFAEQNEKHIFSRHNNETNNMYLERINLSYASAIKKAGIYVPAKFEKILLTADTIAKCGMELSSIDISTENCDIKGLAYEDTIRGTFDKSDNQQYFTPYQIVDFVVDIMKPFLNGVVCDPACGTAGFLTRAASKAKPVNILGFEVDERLAWVSSLNLLIHGCKKYDVNYLSNGGSLGDGAEEYFGTIDSIITNPPFGSDYTDIELLNRYDLGRGKRSRRRGILFIEQSWNLLKNGGVVAIIIDQSVLNSGSNIDVRKYIISHFKILAIIDLPDSAFMPYASVSTSILILQKVIHPTSQNDIFFAKSKKIGRKPNGDDDLLYSTDGEPRMDSDFPNILSAWKTFNDGNKNMQHSCFQGDISATLEENPNIRLDYDYHHPVRQKSKELIENAISPLYTLAEICTERNITYIPTTDNEASSITFTGLANIEPLTGKVIQTEVPAASIKSAVKRYEPGDIVFSKMRPSLRKVAVMDFENGGYVSSECIVLSVRKDEVGNFMIEPELLSTILRSDFVYGQIMGSVTGIGRPRIGSKDLRNIKIPIPDLEVQRKATLSIRASLQSVAQLREKANMLNNEADELEINSINNIAKFMSGGTI